MPISFPCPTCSKRIRISSEHAGRTGRCPKCRQALQIPTAKQLADLALGVEVTESGEDTRPTESGEVFNTMVGEEAGKAWEPNAEEEKAKLEQQKVELAWAKLEFERAKLAKEKESSGAEAQPVAPATPAPRKRSKGKRSARQRMRDAAELYRSGSDVGETEEPDTGFERQELEPVEEVPCPDCAEMIKAAAKVCRFCGCEFKSRASGRHRASASRRGGRVRAPSGAGAVAGRKEPGIAAVMSVLIPGLGLIYLGNVLFGLMVVIFYPAVIFGLYWFLFIGGIVVADDAGALLGMLVWLFVAFFAFVGQVVYTYKAAVAHNRRLGMGRRRRR
ncbi:MAG: hypothetical protein R3F62_06940 [Planctomycetota bacterium]